MTVEPANKVNAETILRSGLERRADSKAQKAAARKSSGRDRIASPATVPKQKICNGVNRRFRNRNSSSATIKKAIGVSMTVPFHRQRSQLKATDASEIKPMRSEPVSAQTVQ